MMNGDNRSDNLNREISGFIEANTKNRLEENS
jgi:hypothetical protein